jgi:hypothetical protein
MCKFETMRIPKFSLLYIYSYEKTCLPVCEFWSMRGLQVCIARIKCGRTVLRIQIHKLIRKVKRADGQTQILYSVIIQYLQGTVIPNSSKHVIKIMRSCEEYNEPEYDQRCVQVDNNTVLIHLPLKCRSLTCSSFCYLWICLEIIIRSGAGNHRNKTTVLLNNAVTFPLRFRNCSHNGAIYGKL